MRITDPLAGLADDGGDQRGRTDDGEHQYESREHRIEWLPAPQDQSGLDQQ
jgi:hypothetical protein